MRLRVLKNQGLVIFNIGKRIKSSRSSNNGANILYGLKWRICPSQTRPNFVLTEVAGLQTLVCCVS